jgi:hypothetical protein
MALSAENYRRGFLLDEELMGGITEIAGESPRFAAFVLRHTTGEYLGYQEFNSLQQALETLNRVERPWKFEKSSGGCGACADGTCGKAAGGGCLKRMKRPAAKDSALASGQTGANGDGAGPCASGACAVDPAQG